MSENKRDSFVFYRSFYEAMEDLSDAEQLTIYKAIVIYALEGVEPNITGYPKAIFKLIRPIIEANNKRWKNGKKGAEHGVKGGRPKKGKETPKQPQENPTRTPNKDKDVDKDVNVDEERSKEETQKRFAPPSKNDVVNFFISKKNISSADADYLAERFIDFYDSKGWMVGQNKMKNWESSATRALSWEDKREKGGNNETEKPKYNFFRAAE
jgi:hypothetical protein